MLELHVDRLVSGRMSGSCDDSELAIAEHIGIPVERLPLQIVFEVSRVVQILLVNRRFPGYRKFGGLHIDVGVFDELEAACVIEVQMRDDDGVHVHRRQTEHAELAENVPIFVHLNREGSRGFTDTTDRVGHDLWMKAGVEEDATVRMLDEVEEIRAVDLGAHVLVQRIERRQIRSVTTAETGEDLH